MLEHLVDVTRQMRLHEIADQKIVENLILHGGHQRIARHLEGETAGKIALGHFDQRLFAADPEADEVYGLRDLLNRREILAQVVLVVAGQRLFGIVAEFLRVDGRAFIPLCRERSCLVAFAIVADVRRKELELVVLETVFVVRPRRRLLVRPDAVGSLKGMTQFAPQYRARCDSVAPRGLRGGRGSSPPLSSRKFSMSASPNPARLSRNDR